MSPKTKEPVAGVSLPNQSIVVGGPGLTFTVRDGSEVGGMKSGATSVSQKDLETVARSPSIQPFTKLVDLVKTCVFILVVKAMDISTSILSFTAHPLRSPEVSGST